MILEKMFLWREQHNLYRPVKLYHSIGLVLYIPLAVTFKECIGYGTLCGLGN